MVASSVVIQSPPITSEASYIVAIPFSVMPAFAEVIRRGMVTDCQYPEELRRICDAIESTAAVVAAADSNAVWVPPAVDTKAL